MNFNLNLSQKLMAAFTGASFMLFAVGAFSFFGMRDLSSAFHKVTDRDFVISDALGDMRTSAMAVARNLAILSKGTLNHELRKVYEERLQKRISVYEEANEKLESIGFSKEENKKLFSELKERWPLLKADATEILKLTSAERDKNLDAADRILLEDFEKNMDEFTRIVKALNAGTDQSAKDNIENAAKIQNFTNTTNIFVIVIGTLCLLMFGFLFSRSIANKINAVVKALSESADQISAASSEVASSSQQLSQATTEQAASLEETAASLEQISSMVGRSAESSALTETSSSASLQKAEEGKVAVDQMLRTMTEISESSEEIMNQVNRSNQEMAGIINVINEIGNKTKVINEIVFQTKLLSFNASVEAARAGEHGKGFAVVAEEVGSLAQMSGNAAKEITDMLDSSISKVDLIVKNSKTQVESLVGRSKLKVDAGVTVAEQCSEVLAQIVGDTSKVTGLAQEISTASKEQAQGVGEINKAMSQLDIVTQQNAATSEEAASAAEELSAQVESLKACVEDLVVIVQGSKRSASENSIGNSQYMDRHSFKKVSGENFGPSSVHSSETIKFSSGENVPGRNDSGFKDI